MDFDKLRQLDAANTAKLEPAAAAAWFNANVPQRQVVPRWMVKDVIYRSGSYPLLLAGQASENATVRGLAITAAAYLNDVDFQNIDLDLPGVGDMLDGLNASGILSTAALEAIEDMADVEVPRWKTLGLYEAVGDQQIIKARQE